MSEARRQGALTVAITNVPDSPLSRAAAHGIALHARQERAVAATKTYTTELMALATTPSGPTSTRFTAAISTSIAGDGSSGSIDERSARAQIGSQRRTEWMKPTWNGAVRESEKAVATPRARYWRET